METLSLRVQKLLGFASFQDLGRFGYTDIGVCNSGVSDNISYAQANILCQNNPNTPIIEIYLGGMDIEVTQGKGTAVLMRDTSFLLNSKATAPNKTFNIKKGDIISLDFSSKLSYFAISGEFLAPKILDSHSVCTKDFLGTPLKQNSLITCHSKPFSHTNTLKPQHQLRPTNTLRLIPCYQYESFSQCDKEIFFSTTYEITKENNKMGYKLQGSPLKTPPKGIISEGIAFGSVQIMPNGQPAVLLKDAQTIGGYAKIGTVLPIDCYKLAHLKTSTKLQFKKLSLQTAINLHNNLCKIIKI